MNNNDFSVSTLGRDSWSGRLAEPAADGKDGPFATLAGARDALRVLKQSAHLSVPVTVWVRGGIYPMSEPLVFKPEDSAPVTYRSYPDEQPILDGGKAVEGWREAEAGGVRMWVAHIPEVVAGRWYFRQLYVNGERRQRPRLPKQGFYRIKDVPGTGLNIQGMASDLLDGTDTFICEPGHIRSWKNLNDVDVVAIHFWVEERMPIASFDERTGTVKSSRKSIFVLKDDIARRYPDYYVENVFEALSEPGEWYLDRSSGTCYYIPLPGETIATTEIFACAANQLVRLEGDPDREQYVEFIGFKELTFRHTDWMQPRGSGERPARPGTEVDYAAAPQAAVQVPGVIHMEGARYCSIEDCRIERIGWYGIELSDGCTANRIVGNTIADMGAGGIKLGGSDADGPVSRRTGNNRITDNEIRSGGRIFHSAVGIVARHSFGNDIAHNRIHDLYYTGISCGWVWGYGENVSKNNRIEKNHIHDLGHGLLSDMGGVYPLGVQPGTVVRGNLIHDIEKRNYGGWALYPDEGSSHILFENNICCNTSSQVFFQHYGRENIVRNNIFAFGQDGQLGIGILETHQSLTFERNIVITENQPLFVAGDFRKHGFYSDLNLFWDISGSSPASGKQTFDEEANFSLTDPISIEELKKLGYDLHSIVADPRVRDTGKRDFTLMDDSPAFALGFRPIEMSDVGPRPTGQRD